MGIFFKRSRAAYSAVHGRIVPNFKLIRDVMVILHTCNNEEDPIKNEGARVLTRLYVIFSDAQGQITQQSAVKFFRNSNLFKLLWLSSLPATMKKIKSKTKELEC